MLIRNLHVNFGVGMSIGSVPPNSAVNCIRNITFDYVTFSHPLKAIYIKTDPGDSGTGIIENITYQNFHVKEPLWYGIWIGPQQQKQPYENGTGCSFFYPIDPHCPTQPRVPISNIVLNNITITKGLTLPGVLLCDPSKKCLDFSFENVFVSPLDGHWGVQDEYVCQNVEGTCLNCSPQPPCLSNSSMNFIN